VYQGLNIAQMVSALKGIMDTAKAERETREPAAAASR
jgi:hypothetical protein